MTINKLLLAAAAIAPAAFVYAAPAQAQVAGIATANPTVAVIRSKAYAAAGDAVSKQYANDITALNAKNVEMEKALTQLDKNNDGRVEPAEFEAAKTAKNPAYDQYQTLNREITGLQTPMARSQAFALEMILKRYGDAEKTVVDQKKIAVILQPEAFLYAPAGVDVTPAITAALDTLVPSVPITVPDKWDPSDATLSMLKEISQMEQYARAVAAARAQQQGGQPVRQQGAQPPAQQPKPSSKPQTR